MGTGGGTAGTYRWMQTFFPKIPVLKVTVPYLGTVNFFAHESHCTVGTKKFFFAHSFPICTNGTLFFPHSIRKCTSGTLFLHIQLENVPAVQIFLHKIFGFRFFWPLLAILSHFLVIFGQKLRKFFHFVPLVHTSGNSVRNDFSFVPSVRTSGKSARIFFLFVPSVRTSCKSARNVFPCVPSVRTWYLWYKFFCTKFLGVQSVQYRY